MQQNQASLFWAAENSVNMLSQNMCISQHTHDAIIRLLRQEGGGQLAQSQMDVVNMVQRGNDGQLGFMGYGGSSVSMSSTSGYSQPAAGQNTTQMLSYGQPANSMAGGYQGMQGQPAGSMAGGYQGMQGQPDYQGMQGMQGHPAASMAGGYQGLQGQPGYQGMQGQVAASTAGGYGQGFQAQQIASYLPAQGGPVQGVPANGQYGPQPVSSAPAGYMLQQPPVPGKMDPPQPMAPAPAAPPAQPQQPAAPPAPAKTPSKMGQFAGQMGHRLADSTVFGFGATIGSDAANSLWHHL